MRHGERLIVLTEGLCSPNTHTLITEISPCVPWIQVMWVPGCFGLGSTALGVCWLSKLR